MTTQLTLREYQAAAIAACYEHLRSEPGNPCIVLPTGAGKTPVLASIAADCAGKWGGRALVLSHVKELVAQSSAAIGRWFPGVSCGVNSAGLGRRDCSQSVIVAGVQSVADSAAELTAAGPFNLVLVDEAHRIPPAGEGQYQRLLGALAAINPKLRIIGLTATPYRLDGGSVVGDGKMLSRICYEAKVGDLISDGYLSNVTSKRGRAEADLSGVRVERGEFAAEAAENAFGDVVTEAVKEIVEQASDRRSVIIFAQGVEHAASVLDLLHEAGQPAGLITGTTPPMERERLADDFKRNRLKYLVNVNVLCEGFDATCVDMVVLLRATMSPGLFYQMVGRGLRLHEGKTDCRVLDFGGNVRRHGCIDAIVPPSERKPSEREPICKDCPHCQELVPVQAKICPACGSEFASDEREINHESKAEDTPILSSQVEQVRHEVTEVKYYVHAKRGGDEFAPRTLRVSYYRDWDHIADEWICIEHTGWAWNKAKHWWTQRSENWIPKSVERAVEMATRGGLAETKAIWIYQPPGNKYPQVVKHELGEIPPAFDEGWIDGCMAGDELDKEIPF